MTARTEMKPTNTRFAVHSVLYGLTGIINIALGLQAICVDRKPSQRNRYAQHLAWALFIPAQLLAASRFSFRYICKALQKARSQKHGKGVQRKEKPPPPKKGVEERDADADEHPEMPSNSIRQISEQLHFVDLVNTSHASKALRMRVLGKEDVPDPEQLDDFRQATCQNNVKSSCEMCGIQICLVSQFAAAPRSVRH